MSVTIKVLPLSQKLLIKFVLKILDILSDWIFIPEKPTVNASQCYKCCRHIPTSHAVSLWNRVKAQLSFTQSKVTDSSHWAKNTKPGPWGGAVGGRWGGVSADYVGTTVSATYKKVKSLTRQPEFTHTNLSTSVGTNNACTFCEDIRGHSTPMSQL